MYFTHLLSFIYYFHFNVTTKTPDKDQFVHLCTMVKKKIIK